MAQEIPILVFLYMVLVVPGAMRSYASFVAWRWWRLPRRRLAIKIATRLLYFLAGTAAVALFFALVPPDRPTSFLSFLHWWRGIALLAAGLFLLRVPVWLGMYAWQWVKHEIASRRLPQAPPLEVP